ncbi:ABC transporter substrate-binding protein [Pseudonocardiaceae bacterium YIM PH 21723]|nr:ABC transporter substrate-binding protein [Pseudonocardiaceae bacterium YIM PH 21723]
MSERMSMDRRGFLGLTAVSALALAGCGGGHEQPRNGGRLRALFAGGGAKETLDPHAANLFIDQARHKAIFDKLTELGSDLAPVPRLAESWEVGEGATVWRIRLRDAVFHNGKKLSSEDVLYSFARILDPNSAEFTGKSNLSTLDLPNCRAIDPRTVELRLNRPNADLPTNLAALGVVIVPDGFKDPAQPVGTGPFKFGSFTAGRTFTATRFDQHWEGAPRIDELHILSADADARGNALRSGQAEYAHEVNPTFARTVAADKSAQIIVTPGCTTQAFALKTDRPPFDNPDVVLAFKLIADRQRLVDVVLAGKGQVGNDLYGKGYRYYPQDLPQRSRDPEQARSLLRKAGALNTPLTLYTSSASAGFVEAATLFAQQCGEAGVKVDVQTGPSETFWKDQLVKGEIGSHRSGAMPIPEFLNIRMLTNSPYNISAWRHADFDADFAAAQSTVDEAERAALYQKLQRRVYDKAGLLVWGHPDWLNAATPKLHGIESAPPNTLNWARFDKAWLS